MTELTLEDFLTIVGLISAGGVAYILRIESIFSDLCRRITKEETKSEIYHPDGTKK